MKISIFGSGYVGLVTGACFSELGNTVCCVDVDAKRVELLKKGQSPIFEPGLEAMLQYNIAQERLDFTLDPKVATAEADIIFIAVGTPSKDDGSADLQYVMNVAETIGRFMSKYTVIVNKSTVPVGTADAVSAQVQAMLDTRGEKIPFDVVSNPEFLKEGAAIDDCMRPDRIVIGSESEKAINLMKILYGPFSRNHDKLMIMDVRSAEMTKYVSNAMLATKISFMNEMSQIAERVGADIEKVRRGIGSDSRIGYSFIYPGCGYGGSCFPKDVRALIHTADMSLYDSKLLRAVDTINNKQKNVLFYKILKHFNEELANKTFAIWGLSFKPNTDDIREAPSIALIEKLIEHGACIRAYDPSASDSVQRYFGNNEQLILCDSAKEVLDNSDALVIMTEWLQFRSPDFGAIKDKLTNPIIFDGRNLYDPEYLHELGFSYYAIGRGKKVLFENGNNVLRAVVNSEKRVSSECQ